MPSAPAAPSAGYHPRPASNQLKEIVEENIEELLQVWDERFRDTYGPLHRRVRTVLEDFLRCGDLHFGFVRLKCCNPECPKKSERIVPYSCRGRGLCPSCGQKRALAWAERMVGEVRPIVPYRQLVFTIPDPLRGCPPPQGLPLRPLPLRRPLPGSLRIHPRLPAVARVASHSSAEGRPGHDRLPPVLRGYFGAPPARPRVVSLGLFRPDGVFLPMDDVDFSGLEKVFRERFFRMMLRRERVRPETVERMRAWDHSGFAVNWERKIDRYDRKGLEGLLSYMERAPVSLRRLTYRQDQGLVHYQGINRPIRHSLCKRLLLSFFKAVSFPPFPERESISFRF